MHLVSGAVAEYWLTGIVGLEGKTEMNGSIDRIYLSL